MFIESISIKEFRGIKNMEALNLRRFNIIIGRNNSGKTAILESLSLFPYPFKALSTPWTKEFTLDFIVSYHSSLESLVYGYSGEAEISYKFKIDSRSADVSFRIDAKGNVVVKFMGKEVTPKEYLGQLQAESKLNEYEIIKHTFYMPSADFFIKRLHETICDLNIWNSIVKSKVNIRVVRDIINKAVKDEFTEILLGHKNRLMLRKEILNEGVLYIDVDDLGDGIKRALLLALTLEYFSPAIVLIDDIERSAHPGLLSTIIKWLSEKNWQVIISTHSIDTLISLVDLELDDFQLIALNKGNDDILRFSIYEKDELEDLIMGGIDIRKTLDLV